MVARSEATDSIHHARKSKLDKYKSKIIGLYDWTKFITVCDSFFKKPTFIVYCLLLLLPNTHKAC